MYICSSAWRSWPAAKAPAPVPDSSSERRVTAFSLDRRPSPPQTGGREPLSAGSEGLMRTPWIAAAGVAMSALALAGCNPPHPQAHVRATLKTISRLDCPEEQGDLKLQSQASDGLACAYADNAGDQVNLQLVSLQ